MKQITFNHTLLMNPRKATSLFLFMLCCIQFLKAGNETVNNRISGSQILNNASVSVQDNNYPNVELSGAAKVAAANGTVIFSIDNASNLFYNTSHTVRVGLTVKSYDKNGVLQTLPSSVELEIGYSPTGSYKDKSVYVVNGSHKISATIQYIKDGTNTVIPPASIPQNLSLEVEQTSERYYTFSTSASVYPIMNAPLTTDVPNEIDINWNTQAGAEEYELEWTYANNYPVSGSTPLSASNVFCDFKNNSTRVRISQNHYPIALIYDHGYVVYRVRAIGRSLTDLKELHGSWNETESGQVNTYGTNNYKLIDATNSHETAKNWQYSASYAEEGKKKEVMSYFDGSLRNRQSVTKLNTDNKAIIGETIYDHQGRGAIQVLPTPTNDDELKYYNDYNKSAVSGNFYNRDNFDVDGVGTPCETPTDGMSTTTGSSNYYSASNPDKAGVQAYVPDAELYPFSQVEYTPDNTGRIRKQSGVGVDHKLGSTHETKYYYGQPDQVQLDRMFGSEVGDFNHYKKNMVQDANGQISVSYLDQQGRVIATSLAGESPGAVNALSGNNPATELTSHYLKAGDTTVPNANRIENNALIFSKELLVTNEADYDFYYDMEAPVYTDTCLPSPICYDCMYDLEIRLVDECGLDKFPPVNELVGQIDTVCGTTITFNSTHAPITVIDLEPGNYTLYKKLTISQTALDLYTDNFLRNNECIKTYEDFLATAIDRIDTTACDISCDSCVAWLGPYSTHNDWDLGNPESGTYDPNYEYMTEDEWNKAKKECTAPCEPINLCESQYLTLLSDVSPGGQYAKYEVDGSGNYSAADPLSLFNNSNVLPGGITGCPALPHWQNPKRIIGSNPSSYYNEDGSLSKIYLTVLPDGSYYPLPDLSPACSRTYSPIVHLDEAIPYIYPQDLLNVSDFINAFSSHPEWAKSLVEYHPEYAYYDWCIDNSDETVSKLAVSGTDYTSDSFDDLLRSKNTAASAIAAGFITGTTEVADVLSKDPYFSNSASPNAGKGYPQLGVMTGLLADYNGSSLTLETLTANAVLCGTTYYGSCSAAFIDGTTAEQDEQWVLYRNIYLAEKQKLQQKAANTYATWTYDNRYNGCIGIGANSYNPWGGGPFNWASTDEPCGVSTWFYYKDKVKRFQNGADILPGVDPFGDAAAGSSTLTNTAEYNSYLQTGQCPVTTDLGYLLDNLVQNGSLTTDTSLLGFGAFSKKLYDAVKIPNLPATSSFIEYFWMPSVSDEVLTVEFRRNSTGGDVDGGGSVEGGCVMTLTLPDGYSWSDVIRFSGIQFASESSGTYTFTIYAYIDSNTGDLIPAEKVVVTGTTCLVLDGCTFPNSCGTSEMALNVQNLFNAMLAQGEFKTGANIDEAPYEALLIDKLLAASGSSITASTWSWNNTTKIGTLTYAIDETTQPPCTFEFQEGVVVFNIDDVVYFTDITPDASNPDVFTMKAWLENGTSRIITVENTEGCFNYKTCAPPPNLSCTGPGYETNETFLAGLNTIARQGKLLTDVGLSPLPDFADLFNVSPEPAGWNFVSVNNTTKLLIITIKNASDVDECELSMQFEDTGNSHNFSDVVGFANLEVPASGDGEDFKVTAIFSDGTTQLLNCSSDCVILKSCEHCSETSVVATLLDMDFDSYSSGAPGFTSARTYDAGCSFSIYPAIKYHVEDDVSTDCSSNYYSATGTDHTNPGTGLFLLNNFEGSGTSEVLWEKTISTIQPYTDYELRYWIQRCNPVTGPKPAWSTGSLQVEVDGTSYNTTIPSSSGTWTEITKTWNSGNNTSGDVTIKIKAGLTTGVLGIDDITFKQTYTSPCATDFHNPTTDSVLTYVNPCVQNLKDIAAANALASYNFYIDSVENAFRENYLTQCMSPAENLKMEYPDSEHHFTLYYYDQAGNLVRTVPPQGVVLVTDPSDLTQIAQDRASNTQTYFTQHSYITRYEYNSLNQLLRQSVPDHELMNKWEMNGLGTLPSGYNIYGMAFSNGDNGFVVGDDGSGNGIVYLTTDGGTTWSPASSLGVDNLQDIQMIGTTGYALTDEGYLVKTTNTGAAWTIQATTGITSKLNDLHFTTAADGIIIGDDGVILITDDGGATWNPPTTVPSSVGTRDLNDLQYLASATKWYIAGDDGTLIKSTDYGDTWTAVSPAISSDIDLNALDFSNDPQGYVAGINTANNSGVVLYYNSGWTAQLTTVANATEFTALNVTSTTGYAGGTNGVMYKTTNGTTWFPQAISGFTATVTEMDFPSPLIGYATASDGSILALSSGTWTVPLNPVTTSLNGLYFTSSTDGYAVGNGGVILDISSSGTAAASMTNVNFNDLNDACFAEGSTTVGYAVGETGTIVKTTDGGATWSNVTNANTTELNAVYFTNASTGVMVGNGGLVLTTTNGGSSLTTQTSGTSENLNDIVNASVNWVAVGDNRKIIYSANTTSWSAATITSGTETLHAVYFVGATGYACGSNGVVFKSTDDALTWNPTGITGTAETLREVYFRDYLTGYVMGDNGTILKTVDGGTNWITETGPSGNYYTAAFDEEGHALIAGTGTNNISGLEDEANDHSTRFWYDRLGRMIVSQNSKQFAKSPKAYSYTVYDDLGRITEVGENGTSSNINDYASVHGVIGMDTDYTTWLASGTHTEITTTLYDEEIATPIAGFTQENLRKRVSSVSFEATDDADASTFDHATHFSYDIHGNVNTLIQDNPSLATLTPSQQYKKIDYIYDLVSGKVNQVSYQSDQPDAFYHQYEYDADNRITNVLTSKDGVIWDKEANYFYYQHGPLARVELGDQKVQAMDYAYTIQGWIKGVNSNTLKQTRDIGLDGETTSTNLHQHVGRDAAGYSLNYFSGDYASIGTLTSTTNFIASTAANTGLATDAPDLYNGNIKNMVTAINDLTTPSAPVVSPQLTAYKYDQLNRINRMKAYRDINLSGNVWQDGTTYDGSYETELTYDANGNIETLTRKGLNSISSGAMDVLDYKYENISGSYTRNTNKLRSVTDAVSSGNYATDIDNQGADNYEYDAIGNLIADAQEEIDNIDWTVYGKIKSISRTTGSTKPDLVFNYDASGNRISKTMIPRDISGQRPTDEWITTYYVRDAQGNVMSTYEKEDASYKLKEQMLYGSSRLGTLTRDINLVTYSADDVVSRTVGKKTFEVSNHLGNVLSTVSDRKLPVESSTTAGTVGHFTSEILSSTDYYAFGSPMPGRTFVGANGYRFGFNGKEKDDEAKGNGNSYDFDARIYDPRIGRFLSTDPLAKSFAFNSPYLFAGNSPIQAIDLNGQKIYVVTVNGGLVDATATLIQTPNGRALIAKYNNSTTDDIYIAVAPHFISEEKDAAGAGKAVALTLYDANRFVDEGKLMGLEKAHNEAAENALDEGNMTDYQDFEEAAKAFKVFDGVDVSKSKGRTISLVVLDDGYMKEGMDKYENAETIYHEIYAHIELEKQGIEDGDVQHLIYGNTSYNTPAQKGTPGAVIQQQLKQVKSKDDKSKQEKSTDTPK